MRGLSGGVARGDDSQSKRLARIEKSVNLLDQRFSRFKVPDAATGIVGQVSFQSNIGTFTWPAGVSDPDWEGVTYQSPVDEMPPYDPVSPSWLNVQGPDIYVTESGWYEAHAFVSLRWGSEAGAPLSASISAGGPNNGAFAAAASTVVARTPLTSSEWGIVRQITPGKFYMNAGESYWRFEADMAGGSAAGITTSLSTSYVWWTITKLA